MFSLVEDLHRFCFLALSSLEVCLLLWWLAALLCSTWLCLPVQVGLCQLYFQCALDDVTHLDDLDMFCSVCCFGSATAVGLLLVLFQLLLCLGFCQLGCDLLYLCLFRLVLTSSSSVLWFALYFAPHETSNHTDLALNEGRWSAVSSSQLLMSLLTSNCSAWRHCFDAAWPLFCTQFWLLWMRSSRKLLWVISDYLFVKLNVNFFHSFAWKLLNYIPKCSLNIHGYMVITLLQLTYFFMSKMSKFQELILISCCLVAMALLSYIVRAA